MEFFTQVAERLRFADLVDIAVVSVVVYGLLDLLSRARSRSVAMVGAAVGLLYLVASVLGMHLTTLLIQAGFFLFALALLIAFQDDIRRFFQRLASFRFSRRDEVHATAIDAVVDATQMLVEQQVGALLVFEGAEPIDGFLTGGVALDAVPSVALVESLFDAKTPGHDGALVFRDGRAAAFAVHLPLSEHEHVGYGTRHRSAIGLSERSDALVLVISEERAQARVSEQGKLSHALTPAELRERLDDFEARQTRQAPSRSRRPYLGPVLKVAAVATAVVLWVAFGPQVESVQRTFRVAIEYRNLPETLRIEDGMRHTAVATLSGPHSALRGLVEDELRLALDLSDLEPGLQPVVLAQDAITLPSGVVALEIKPGVLNLRLSATEVRSVPITVVTRGALPPGARVLAEPPTVQARVLLGSKDVAKTTPISVEELMRSKTVKVNVLLPQSAQTLQNTTSQTQVSLSLPPALAQPPPKPLLEPPGPHLEPPSEILPGPG